MGFINELKIRVIDRFGREIKTKPDAQELRDLIFKQQKELLSESTIRRFFNLIPSGKTSRATADVFARFIGFKTYQDFYEHCEKSIFLSTKNNFDYSIFKGLEGKNNLTILEINFIVDRIVHCLKEQNEDLLQQYFNLEILYELIIKNDTTHDLFAQTLGPYIENEEYIKDISKITSTKYFIPLVLHKYVDIQNKRMERYYKCLIKNYKNPHDLIFSASILSLNRIYSGHIDRAQYYFNLIDKNVVLTSPVLIGRIALLDWIFSDDMDKLIKTAKRNSENLLFFSIDVVSYLVYSNQIKALKEWFLNFPTIQRNENTWVEKEIISFYNLAKCIAEENLENLRIQMDQKLNLLNSNTTFSKIYPIIEKRYLVK